MALVSPRTRCFRESTARRPVGYPVAGVGPSIGLLIDHGSTGPKSWAGRLSSLLFLRWAEGAVSPELREGKELNSARSLCVVLLCLCSFGCALPGGGGAPLPFPGTVLDRVAVTGASASAGFGTETTLARVVDALLLSPQGKTASFSSTLFFASPRRSGAVFVDGALAFDPSAVLAIDFLFWFSYGQVESEEARSQLFEDGLALLERIECPLAVAEVPYVPDAFRSMGMSELCPASTVIDACNRRLRTWAEARSNVRLIPLARSLESLREGRAVPLLGGRVDPVRLPDLFQEDGLHPTLEGLVFVGALGLQSLVGADSGVVHGDLEGVVRALERSAVSN